MSVLKIPKEIPVYGTPSKEFHSEDNEQITFINHIRIKYPDTYGKIITHVKNERQLRGSQFSAINKDKAMGQIKGCSDIIIPGNPAFVCEMKSRSARAKISDEEKRRKYDLFGDIEEQQGAGGGGDAFDIFQQFFSRGAAGGAGGGGEDCP